MSVHLLTRADYSVLEVDNEPDAPEPKRLELHTKMWAELSVGDVSVLVTVLLEWLDEQRRARESA